jgi:catechol 2,3-dioxygenase-like lactoylglutathione lyase family enzyme
MPPTPYVPPNVLPASAQKIAPLLKRRWVRELILFLPTLTRKRFSNKTEDYGVFQPSRISHLGQVAIYVQDLERSRRWYERLAALRHSRTCEPEPHPFKPDWKIRCCYLSAAGHEECLVLVEDYDPKGKISVPSGMSFFHFAMEIEGNSLEDVFTFTEQAHRSGFMNNYGPVRHNSDPPHGDGETGGNVASYFYDPDYHNVEFCGAMDTIENYRARYGECKGSERQ